MNKIAFLIITFLLIGCGKPLFGPDKLSLERKDYFGDELKISGYYYRKYSTDNTYRYVIYFFYNNGVLFHAGTIFEENLSKKEEEFKNGVFYNNTKNTRFRWGIYTISENKIKFERWYPGEAQKAFVSEGTILNDTTFHITKSYRNQNGEKTEIRPKDEVYHFKKFSTKPDSTNKYTD